jgi:hypothetical protein
VTKTQARALIAEGLADLTRQLQASLPELTELIGLQSPDGVAMYQERVNEIIEGVDRRWQARLQETLAIRSVSGRSYRGRRTVGSDRL